MKSNNTNFKISCIIGFLLFSSIPLLSQNVKGFYVNGFNTILGNTFKEDSLLVFAQNNGFNYLTLYDMHLVNNSTPLTNYTSAQTFADFVYKAKTQYGISEIGIAAENLWFFTNIIGVYNQQHPSNNNKVDVYNLEFEFWVPSLVTSGGYYCTTYLQPGGYSCDTSGAFLYYKGMLKSIDSLANLTGQKSEAYFGFFNSGQAQQIVQTGVDRVLVSIYIPSGNYSPTYQYNYVKPRLQDLALVNTNVKVMPLYSSEPAFMQSWVTTNPFFLPYDDFVNSLSLESGLWKNYIQPEGIQWFAYSFLPKKNMTVAVQEEKNSDFIFSPNPVRGNITIEIKQSNLESTLRIHNVLGKIVYSQKLVTTKTIINTEKFSKGVYFVSIEKNNSKTTKKMIVE